MHVYVYAHVFTCMLMSVHVCAYIHCAFVCVSVLAHECSLEMNGTMCTRRSAAEERVLGLDSGFQMVPRGNSSPAFVAVEISTPRDKRTLAFGTQMPRCLGRAKSYFQRQTGSMLCCGAWSQQDLV